MTKLGTLQKADNQALIPSEETLALSVIRRVQMDGGLEKKLASAPHQYLTALSGCRAGAPQQMTMTLTMTIVRQCCL